ncbi:MAG: CHAP domain-containing protein [Patescibacteria group bacterium]
MALLEEIEPPSYKTSEKTKESGPKSHQSLTDKTSTKTKHQFNNYLNQFRTVNLSSLSSRLNVLKTGLIKGFKEVRNFIFSNKYLPHVVLVSLGLLVITSNFSDKVAAEAFYNDFISTGPDAEYAVASSIDQYTNLIQGDSESVKKQIIASNTEGGFVNSSSSFTTQLTSRETPLPDNSAASVEYIVRNGDTLTGLGWKFEVKLSTLKYVNDIDNADSIRPGVKLTVPKKGYEVSASAIAKKEADKQAKLAAASRNTVTRNTSSSRALAANSNPTVKKNPGSSKNGYPYGYCTYYVATRRYVPTSWGDAKNWLNSATRAGYQTGSTPAVGAIVVTRESWWGHVAYVESVNGNEITISEMNAKGWGVTSRRTLSASGGVVRGYIY